VKNVGAQEANAFDGRLNEVITNAGLTVSATRKDRNIKAVKYGSMRTSEQQPSRGSKRTSEG
jgi:hypothetical protein